MTEKLKFKGRPGFLVPIPRATATTGQQRRYVGHKIEEGKLVLSGVYEVPVDSPRAPKLIKQCARFNALVPADEFTARACGVPWPKPEAPATTPPPAHTNKKVKS